MSMLPDMEMEKSDELSFGFEAKDSQQGRLRSFLIKCLKSIGALACFSIAFFLITAGLYWLLGDYLQFQDQENFSYSGPGLLLSNVCLLIAAISSLVIVSRIFSSLNRLSKTGSHAWDLNNVAKGVMVGFVMISIPFVIVLVFGMIRIAGIDFSLQELTYSLAVLLFAAAFEEILCRSFLLEMIRSFFGTWAGVILSALIFGLGHLANENISMFPMIELLLAGFVLGVFYVKYGLGAAIAFHFIWNFIQGPIYGFKISGTEGYHLFELSFLNQNDILSGIYFGLEGTLWAIMVSVIYLMWVIYNDGFTLGLEKKQLDLKDGMA